MRNNSKGFLSAGQIKRADSQKGVVLFITLIVLVAMMLVAAAMIRSTDTSLLAVGNLSLRQASQAQVSYAVERAVRDVPLAIAGGTTYILPRLQPQNEKGIPDLLQDGRIPPGTQSFSMAVDGGVDAGGFTVYGVVERMCSATFGGSMTTVPDPALCMVTGAGGSNLQTSQRNDGEVAEIAGGTVNGPVFRVTVRVDGPRSTAVYAQAFLS